MARAAHNQTVAASTPTTVFQSSSSGGADGLAPRGIRFSVPSTSAADLLVHIDDVHAAGEWARIRVPASGVASEEFIFSTASGGAINKAQVDSVGAGAATYDYTVTIV